MLEQLRRGAQTWVAKVLFGILVASFGIWGIADVFRGWGRGAIATVGGTKIPAEEFQRAFQNELDRFSREAGKRVTAEQGRALGLDRRVMSQLVGGAAVESHAHDLGLGVSDKSIVDAIQADPDFRGPDGKFSKSYFDSVLRQVGMSERGFLNLRRKDEVRGQLIGTFVKGLVVPRPLIDIVHGYNEEKRVLEWLTIDADKKITVTEPDDAKLKELYEAGKVQYMTPEYRKYELLSLTIDDLKKQVAVPDEEITKTYDTTKDTYDTPEQRRIQQIAFKDKSAADAAKKALDDGSKSFGDIAKDAGAKDTDVDLGLIAKKKLIDPKIAAAAFALEKDKFSDVIEGRFATVILRVTQIEAGTLRTLADVKDQVRDKIAAEKAKDELQKKVDDVVDSRNAGKTLKDIAETMKLSFREVAASDRKGQGPDGKPAIETPDFQKIAAQVFAPDVGSEDQIIDLTGGGHAWVNLLATDAPKQKTFDEVKAEVKAKFMDAERIRLVTELAVKLADRVNAGEPMTALEDASGGKVEQTGAITRATSPQGLTEGAVGQAFALAKGRAGHVPTSDRGSATIFRVVEITPATEPTAEQREKLVKGLEDDLANQALTEYTESLKKRLNASINEAELRAALGTTGE